MQYEGSLLYHLQFFKIAASSVPKKTDKNIPYGTIERIKTLHHALPLHLHQASAITLKNEIKRRCISLSLNKVDMNI